MSSSEGEPDLAGEFKALVDQRDALERRIEAIRVRLEETTEPEASKPTLRPVHSPEAEEIATTVRTMDKDGLDALPYGVITLNQRGMIVNYSDTESRMMGIPKSRVVGKDFFVDVAPCTRVREFEGRFRQLAEQPDQLATESFDFVFKLLGGVQKVKITIVPARTRGQFHVCIVRKQD